MIPLFLVQVRKIRQESPIEDAKALLATKRQQLLQDRSL